jgi:carbon monoxide dehydrogenase subunit G
MKLEQSFEVAAPLETVWKALVDVEHVAPCLPGAAVTGRNDDGSYNGSFTIKIGPTTASYTGRLEMTEIDEDAHTATMHAQGSDKRGQGGAKATIFSTLAPAGDGTRVEVVTDYHITGRLARFGRGGMIEDISERLLREFAQRLQASLVHPVGAAGGNGAPPARAVEAATEPPAPPPAEAAAPPEDAEAPTEAAEAPTEAAEAPAEDAEAPGEVAAAATVGEGRSPTETPSIAEAPFPGATPPSTVPEHPHHHHHVHMPSEPIQGLSLVGGVLLQRFKRNPIPFAFLGGLVLALLLLRRRGHKG